jgi:hypothetical protein
MVSWLWMVLAALVVIGLLAWILSDSFAPLYDRTPGKVGIPLVDRPVDYLAPWAILVGTRYPGNVD